MHEDIPPRVPTEQIIFVDKSFTHWTSLNDTIMGGSSQGSCHLGSNGLVLEGQLVEEGGGFISCRSKVFELPLNLSNYRGVQIEVEGEGRTLKLAFACKKGLLGVENGLMRVSPRLCANDYDLGYCDGTPVMQFDSHNAPYFAFHWRSIFDAGAL